MPFWENPFVLCMLCWVDISKARASDIETPKLRLPTAKGQNGFNPEVVLILKQYSIGG